MWWREAHRRRSGRALRLAAVVAAAALTAGCWQPLYGTPPTPNTEGVQDRFASVEVPPIKAPKGTPTERVAVSLHNALQFNLHNGGSVFAPAYQLKVNVVATQFTAYLDPNTGRPDTQIETMTAAFQLIELATGKIVLNDKTIARVDYDIPGSQQRFAKLRGQHDAEDHAVEVVAQAIRNRLASYFVAGT